ncbi:hypothetical protein R1sor_018099 [Riccia sorocarpa]|uniref:DNA-directed DNA polymerase n=1 Tax=Riccia sorocarpa TaxID=122646 RepID=A0ABD3ICT1_9MARC
MSSDSRHASSSISYTLDDREVQPNPQHHHLRSHVHLTNNIHLRNLLHMQRHGVLMEARNSAELPLMKELTMLRRARSLRDPSTSPAWSSASHGSRKVRDVGDVRDIKLAGNDISKRETSRRHRLRDGTHSTPKSSKREKVDLRGGSHHWVADCFVEEVSEGGFDQKENQVLKNEIRDSYLNNPSSGEPRGETKSSKGTKGRRLNKSRSYPRFATDGVESEEEEPPNPPNPQSARRSRASSELQSEKEETAALPQFDVAALETRVSNGHVRPLEREVQEDERLHRGSMRRTDRGWDETERRAEIARRVISESPTNQVRPQGSELSSPNFSSKKAHLPNEPAQALLSGQEMGGPEPDSERDEYGDSEDEISLRHGLKQLSSSHMSSHAQSPLLYRDSMTGKDSSSSRGGRRKSKTSGGGSKDGPRHREGLNLRVTGSAQGRARGRRSTLRPNMNPDIVSPSCGMEGELEVSELPRNGCGMPWYWTRMHKYKGKRFLDIAGRSLACGLPESSRRKTAAVKTDAKVVVPSINRRPFIIADSPLHERTGFTENSDSQSNFDGDGNDNDSTCSRADAKLLTADRSGELVYGSTREDLSDLLGASSPAYEEALPPMKQIITAPEEPRSLNQKYRPRSFSELVGQNMLVKSLTTAVQKGKIAPVYLFQGPRGTGKTSAARIFAQALNCVSTGSDVNRPCGFCKECTHPSPDIREIDAGSNSGVESVKALMGSMLATPSTSRCKVFIIDGCHLLTTDAWNAFLKALEEPPWHVVFILITTDPEKIPRNATSRCQKFLFSKIREVDIVNRLQILVRMEGLEVDEAALSLVAAQAHGSLRDAEMTLDQLSLLGKHVTPAMVQELVGLVSDDRLIDLLDLALSADAVNTVRCMRELLDGGIEPLALVSQLATLITDILAGSVVIPRDKQMRGFFFRRCGKKEEAVRLRQALKILSEAEKQLRTSSDQATWLTAAILQFAPDRSYQPSSVETSVLASPVAQLNDTSEKETVGESVHPWTSEEQYPYNGDDNRDIRDGGDGPKRSDGMSSYVEAKVYPAESPLVTGVSTSPGDRRSGRPSNARSDEPLLPGSIDDLAQKDYTVMSQRKLEEVWQRVIQGSRSNVSKQLLQGRGKLLSLLLAESFAVAHVEFRHPEHKARAERSRSRICNAFQMALGCPVELQITLACMQGDQDGGRPVMNFTSYEEQFENWQREKYKNKPTSTLEGRAQRRRHRSLRNQRSAESVEIPHSLYNAVMGDNKSFKPEILPAVGSSGWTRQGIRHEEDGAWYRDGKRIVGPSLDFQQHHDPQRARYGPGSAKRAVPGKVLLKTAIHQVDEGSDMTPDHDLQADVICGSNRKKSVKFRDVNGVSPASCEQQESQKGRRRPEFRRFVLCSAIYSCFPSSSSKRVEPRLKTSSKGSRLSCWRGPKLDEEKVKVTQRRRQRRVRFLLRLVPCARSQPSKQNHN